MAKGKRGTGEPYPRGNIYWIKYYVNGEPVRESTGTSSKTAAVKILNTKRKEADDGKLTANKAKVGDLLKLLIAQQKRMQRADIQKVESRINNHLTPAIGGRAISRFTEQDIEDYIDDRLDAGAAPATINRELAALKTALRIARRKHLLNHVIEWDKLPELNIRAGFLDHDDYRRLLRELIDDLKLLLVFGYHYGMRKGELLGYRWEYVDWFAKELRIPQTDTKNKEPKIIPFYGDVEQALKMEKARHDLHYPKSPWIFSRDGKEIRDFRESWDQAVKRAGLQDSLGWFHDLRRSAARNMINAGLDQKMAMTIGGWKTDSIFRRYRITPHRDIQTAAKKMTAFFKKQDAKLKKAGTKVGTVVHNRKDKDIVN